MRCEVLTAVSVHIVVLWVVTLCSLVSGYPHLGDTATLTLRDDAVGTGGRLLWNNVLHVQDCIGSGRYLKNAAFVKITILIM